MGTSQFSKQDVVYENCSCVWYCNCIHCTLRLLTSMSYVDLMWCHLADVDLTIQSVMAK